MLPKSQVLDKTNCLAGLIGIRSACPPGTVAPPYFLEDIEGLDVQKLAKMAKASDLKGTAGGTWIIGSAAREMMGDIELLMNNGYSLKNIIGDNCSLCNLIPTYTQNAGIVVKAANASNFQTMIITRLTILANVTGTKTIQFDDGVNVQTADVDLQAGVLIPINVNYSTSKRSVKIKFTDPTVPLGQVVCQQSGGCGCGSTSATAKQLMVLTGLLAGNETVTQYGFIPCVSFGCSYDALVCGLINRTPNIFGLALLYKIGSKYLISKSQSDRNNDAVSFNEKGEAQLVVDYGRLYWAKMKGTGGVKGIKNIINDYLKTYSNDVCIDCQAKTYTATATG